MLHTGLYLSDCSACMLQVIDRLGLTQDAASGRWVMNTPDAVPRPAPNPMPSRPSSGPLNPMLGGNLQELAGQWIALIASSHRLYTQTRDHNLMQLQQMVDGIRDYPPAMRPDPRVEPALREYLSGMARAAPAELPPVPEVLANAPTPRLIPMGPQAGIPGDLSAYVLSPMSSESGRTSQAVFLTSTIDNNSHLLASRGLLKVARHQAGLWNMLQSTFHADQLLVDQLLIISNTWKWQPQSLCVDNNWDSDSA